MSIPSYIPIPPAAHRISAPPSDTVSTSQPESSGSASNVPHPPGPSPTQPSFPPTATTTNSSSNAASTSSRRFSIPAPSLSTNVSDLLLSSLLPTNLPKLPTTSTGKSGPGRPRELNTQRETLRLDVLSNNFRRFITKVGPVFWLQDRIEEVLFWRKPLWTWAWLMAWTFICLTGDEIGDVMPKFFLADFTAFKPRLLLLVPSLTLTLILLHLSEIRNPLPSLLGSNTPGPSASTLRTTHSRIDPDGGPVSTTTGPNGEPLPVVPPKEAESGVDYYMNIQAIQNTMGWVSDAYDEVYPHINNFIHPAKSPTSLPLTPTHILLLLLPPSLLLPLIPNGLLPYLLLPIGWAPPLAFHPNLVPLLSSFPKSPIIRRAQALLTRAMLTDSLPDDIGRATISEVEVWENERLDPSFNAKSQSQSQSHSGGPGAAGSWGQRFLRAGERMPWVKIKGEGSVWAGTLSGIGAGAGEREGEDEAKNHTKGGDRVGQELKDGWKWIPGEDWRVDVSGLWSDVGVDSDGWVYSDDSWQNLAASSLPLAEIDSPVPALRRVTRRRKWWKRVYHVDGATTNSAS